MAAILISEIDQDALPAAIRTINTGGIVAFPTDTVYGIGVSAFNISSIKNLFLAKGRGTEKAIAILLSEMNQLPTVCSSIPGYAIQLGKAFWPGGLTLVVPRNPEIPEILSPLPTIGVRIPNHSFALGLIRACGPLAVTSANISGKPNATTALEVEQQLSMQVDLIIDGGPSLGGTASTVVDFTGSTCKILRTGAITPEQIFRIIQR